MPRERSTWNVNAIAKRAGLKVADPYLMNQDHVNQQRIIEDEPLGDKLMNLLESHDWVLWR